jgi:hypothetical protein
MQMEEKIFDSFKKQLIKVVFRDGDVISTFKCRFLDYTADFIRVQTLKNNLLISRTSIIKIQLLGDKE